MLLDPSLIPPGEAVRFLSNVLEASTELSIIGLDLEGRILLWNSGAHRLYGWESGDVVGKATWNLLHRPEDVKAARLAEVAEIALREGKWEGTAQWVRRDGSRFTARAVVTPRLTEDGEPEGFLLIAKDITREMRLTHELRASLAYNRSLFESSIGALMTTSVLGVITDVNEQMEALTGRSRDELVGRPFAICATEPERAEEGIRLVLREGRVSDYELTVRRPDGSETIVSCNAATLFDSRGRRRGVFAAARDVTERKRIERTLQEQNLALERANLAKDSFLANVSHELRTPLNAILGFTGTLLMELPGPLTDEQRTQLDTVRSSARHLLAIINDLLDLAKIESGKVELQWEDFDCREIVGDITRLLAPLAAAKGLRFDLDLPERPVIVHTDRRAFSQILINLTSNAIKFTDKGGVRLVVTPSTEVPDRMARVDVVDTGIGIAPADQERLFEPFERAEDRVGGQDGTGLGLPISRRLARLVGVTIRCSSTPGEGSTFTVEFTGS